MKVKGQIEYRPANQRRNAMTRQANSLIRLWWTAPVILAGVVAGCRKRGATSTALARLYRPPQPAPPSW